MQILKYSKADLDPVLAEAVKTKPIDAWTAVMRTNIKSILQAAPERYRAFGPYWYPLKKEFIARGDLSFGEFLDSEWLDAMDYGDMKYNIAAAWAYEETRFNLGLTVDPFHTMEDPDGNPVEFVSADPDMERRA